MADKPERPPALVSEIKTQHGKTDVDNSYIKGRGRQPLRLFIKETPSVFSASPPQLSARVLAGDFTQVRSCVEEKQLDVNVSGAGEPHCLLQCALLSSVESVVKHRSLSELVSMGASKEQRDVCDRTPLHLAVLLGDIGAVDTLLKSGCDCLSKCHGNNILHLAAMSGDCEMFERARLELGCSPALATDYACTAMHIAAVYNLPALIAHLSGLGVDLNTHRRHSDLAVQCFSPVGCDAITSYTSQGLAEPSRGLVRGILSSMFTQRMSNKANVLGKVSKHTFPLVMAVEFCCFDAVECLVDSCGADVGSCAGTLFHTAVAMGSRDLVAFFFERVSRDAIPKDEFLLFMAVGIGAIDVISFLVKNCKDSFVWHFAGNVSSIPRMSVADLACLTNQPAVLSSALTWEGDRAIYASGSSPMFRVSLSILGGWFLFILGSLDSRLLFALNASHDDRMKVMSILCALPQCNLLEIPSSSALTGTSEAGSVSFLDIAAAFCQSAACVAIAAEMWKRSIQLDLSQPLIPASLLLSQTLLKPVTDDISTTLPHLPRGEFNQSEEMKETIRVLCSHGYSINAIIYHNHNKHATCLDIAIELKLLELVPFLRDSGAVTYQHLAVQEQAGKLESRVHQTETERSELKKDKDELAKENEKLQSRNNQLVSHISQLMQYLQPLSSLVSTGLPSGVNCAAPNPSTSITLSNGEELTAYDIRLFAPRWKDVCVRLGLEQPLLEVVEANHPSDCEAACRDMLKRWICEDLGTGTKPRTLDTLCRVLELCECGEYAKILKERHSNK